MRINKILSVNYILILLFTLIIIIFQRGYFLGVLFVLLVVLHITAFILGTFHFVYSCKNKIKYSYNRLILNIVYILYILVIINAIMQTFISI